MTRMNLNTSNDLIKCFIGPFCISCPDFGRRGSFFNYFRPPRIPPAMQLEGVGVEGKSLCGSLECLEVAGKSLCEGA